MKRIHYLSISSIGILTITMASITMLNKNKIEMSKAESLPYTLNLSSSDSNNSLGKVNNRNGLLTSNGSVIEIEQSGLTESTGNFGKLNANGYLLTSTINGINSIKAAFTEGDLLISYGYSEGEFVRENQPLTTNEDFTFGIDSGCNYIKFSSVAGVSITSINISYTCNEIVKPKQYDNSNLYAVGSGTFFGGTSVWAKNEKYRLQVNTFNTDTTCVEWKIEGDFEKGDKFKFLCNDSWIGYSNFDNGEGSAFQPGLVHNDSDDNCQIDYDGNYTVYYKTNGAKHWFQHNGSLTKTNRIYIRLDYISSFFDGGATVTVHHWKSGGAGTNWPGEKATAVINNRLYYIDIKSTDTHLILIRANQNSTSSWTQSSDIQIKSDKNLMIISGTQKYGNSKFTDEIVTWSSIK